VVSTTVTEALQRDQEAAAARGVIRLYALRDAKRTRLILLGSPVVTSLILLLMAVYFYADDAQPIGVIVAAGAVAELAIGTPRLRHIWRDSTTAIGVRKDGIVALHDGHTLREIRWDAIDRIISGREDGDQSWKITSFAGDEIVVHDRIADADDLLTTVRRMAGLNESDEQCKPATERAQQRWPWSR
jgi:hypothetical protein